MASSARSVVATMNKAASLVACCVELEDASARRTCHRHGPNPLRHSTARFPAFQQELRRALGKRSAPAPSGDGCEIAAGAPDHRLRCRSPSRSPQ